MTWEKEKTKPGRAPLASDHFVEIETDQGQKVASNAGNGKPV